LDPSAFVQDHADGESKEHKPIMVLSGSGRSPPSATNRRIRLSHGTNATHSSNNTRGTTDEDDNGSAFFAALSPSTARFLKDGNAAGEQRERILGNNIVS